MSFFKTSTFGAVILVDFPSIRLSVVAALPMQMLAISPIISFIDEMTILAAFNTEEQSKNLEDTIEHHGIEMIQKYIDEEKEKEINFE